MKRNFWWVCILIPFFLFEIGTLKAQSPIPGINISVDQAATPSQVATTLQIVFLLTLLTLAPALLIMTTSFTRFVIVFSFLRQALGTPQTPSNQIVVGLALFLTIFVMMPVYQDINENALQPYLDNRITQEIFLERTSIPVKRFMQQYTREKDLALFMKITNLPRPRTIDDVPIWVVIPAFVLSELKTAFQIGFVIYIPFLVIDMVVSAVLMAMGMMMLPPIMISLPFKLMLFVLVDGWHLLVGSMIKSFVPI